MNNFAYPTGFPNEASFSGSYENVQNYQTIIIDYHTNSTDILTVHYSNDTISDYYTTNYTISNQQLQFVLNPSYTFTGTTVTQGPISNGPKSNKYGMSMSAPLRFCCSYHVITL